MGYLVHSERRTMRNFHLIDNIIKWFGVGFAIVVAMLMARQKQNNVSEIFSKHVNYDSFVVEVKSQIPTI